MRASEITNRFLVVDDIREKANVEYYNKNYEEAIKYYVNAYSFVKWLEYSEDNFGTMDSTKENSNIEEETMKETKEGLETISEKTENCLDEDDLLSGGDTVGFIDRIQKLQQDKNWSKDELKAYAEKQLKERFGKDSKSKGKDGRNLTAGARKMLAEFHDGNVRIANDTACTDPSDMEMKHSIQFGTMINMACAYMFLNHFELAEKALHEA